MKRMFAPVVATVVFASWPAQAQAPQPEPVPVSVDNFARAESD